MKTIYSGIESANEIHVRHIKEIIINQCANIYSRRNTGRPVENCDRFARIPSNSQSGHTDYSKAKRTGVGYDLQRCVTPQLSFLLFRSVAFNYDIKLIYCAVLFFEKFLVLSSKKRQRKRNQYSVIESLCTAAPLLKKSNFFRRGGCTQATL